MYLVVNPATHSALYATPASSVSGFTEAFLAFDMFWFWRNFQPAQKEKNPPSD